MPLDETALQRLARVEERMNAQADVMAALREAADRRAERQEEHAALVQRELKKLTDAAVLQQGWISGFGFAVKAFWFVTGSAVLGGITLIFKYFVLGTVPR